MTINFYPASLQETSVSLSYNRLRFFHQLGPKFLGSYSANDNGFARFDHVRIPKDYMLSRFAQVKDDGTYVRPVHDKVSYGGVRQP